MSSYKPHTIILTPWFEDEEVKILGSEIGLMHRRNEFAIMQHRSFWKYTYVIRIHAHAFWFNASARKLSYLVIDYVSASHFQCFLQCWLVFLLSHFFKTAPCKRLQVLSQDGSSAGSYWSHCGFLRSSRHGTYHFDFIPYAWIISSISLFRPNLADIARRYLAESRLADIFRRHGIGRYLVALGTRCNDWW